LALNEVCQNLKTFGKANHAYSQVITTLQCCKPIFFQMKFTLFGNKRDIVTVQRLACLVLGYTLVAHGRICIHKSQDFLFIFDPPSFGRSYLAQFKPQCRVVNGYSGAK